MKIKKGKFFNLIFQLTAYLLLEIIYIWIISDKYAYSGFTFDFDLSRYIIGTFAAGVATFLLAKLRMSSFIYGILSLLLVLVLYPSTLIYKYIDVTPLILFSHLAYFFSIYIFSRVNKHRIRTKEISENQKSHFLFYLSCLGILPFIFVFGPHINLKNLLLVDIYEARAVQKENLGPITAYLYSWLSRVIIPILLVYAAFQRKKIIVIISFSFLIFLFLCGAHKSVFFGTILLLFFIYGSMEKKIRNFSLGLIFVFSISLFIYAISENFLLAGISARRGFMIPALLDSYYFDFFHDKPLIWSWSFLKSFYQYPFEVLPPYVIGKEFFNQPNMAANNGIISDGYMNLGLLGVFLNIAVVSLLFSYFNNLNINHRFFGIFFILLISLTSSYLPVVLLSHGLIVLLLISQYFLKDTGIIYNQTKH